MHAGVAKTCVTATRTAGWPLYRVQGEGQREGQRKQHTQLVCFVFHKKSSRVMQVLKFSEESCKPTVMLIPLLTVEFVNHNEVCFLLPCPGHRV